MPKFTFRFLFLLVGGLLITQSQSAFAQGTMGVTGQYLKSVGAFQEANYKDGGGLGLEIFSPNLIKAEAPVGIQLGAQLSIGMNGMKTQEIEYTSPTIETWEHTITNKNIGLMAVGRLISTDKLPVRIYLDAMAGTKMFTSDESLDLKGANHSEDDAGCNFETLTRSFNFAYGGSVGTMVKLNDQLSLDFRATYMEGTSAEYVDLSSFQVGKTDVAYDIQRSPMQMLSFQAGVSMKLGNYGNDEEDEMERSNCQKRRYECNYSRRSYKSSGCSKSSSKGSCSKR